jgi:hypothetical protein
MPKSLLVLVATTLTLWVAGAIGVAAQSTPRLWSTSDTNASACRSHIGTIGPQNFNQVVQGHKWPHTPGMGIEFIDLNAKHINAAAIGRANDKALANRLLTAARGGAFTKLDFEGPGGGSPAFASAIIVKSTAYIVAYLRSRNGLTAGELTQIDGWVRKVMRNSNSRANSFDHKAANAASQLMWAAATGNAAEFKQAQRKLMGIFGKLKSNPYFTKDIRNNNETMHHMVHAAAVLRLNGIDVFNAKFGKHSFNDTVAFHAQAVLNNGSRKIKTAGDPSDQARSILRAQGWGTHLAWIPVYLSAQPSGSASAAVRNLNAFLRKSDRKPYWGIQMGVHTGCLFGR